MNATFQSWADGPHRGSLRYQRCQACGRAQAPARRACMHCGSDDLAWHDAGGHGTVVATRVVRRALSEAQRPLVPCTLVLVDLEEGLRVTGQAMPGTAVGDHVRAGCFMHERRALPRFSRTLR